GPDVLGAAAVGHEIHGGPVRAPHRPRVLRAASGDLLVLRAAYDPDFALVEMAVTVSPPLGAGEAARGDRERVAGGRGGAEILRREPVRRDRHRRPAVYADAVDVGHAAQVVAAGREVHERSVG